MFNKIFSLLLILVLFLAGCKSPEQKSDDQVTDSNQVELNSIQMHQITMDTAAIEEEKTDLALSGKVTFDLDYLSPVYSFVSGNVMKVDVSQGDYIKKGQVLAVLKSADVSSYQGQYAVAQAQL